MFYSKLDNSFKLKTLIFFSYSIILIFNNYPNIVINPSGFSDQIQYYKIFLSAPHLSEIEVSDNQAQRFFFIYVFGSIAELLQIKKYYHFLFIIINIVIHFLIVFFFLKILNYLEIKKNLIFFLISIILFNPYIFRSTLYAPLMLNDIMFILGSLLVCLYFLNFKIKYLLIGVCICSLSRQTSMTMIPALIFFMFYNEKKTNVFIFISILLNIFFFFLTKNIANEFSNINNDNLIKSLTGLFVDNYGPKEFLIFLAQIFVSNFMIGILLFLLFLNFKNILKNITYNSITILLVAIGIFAQPILAGPVFSAGNLSRLTVLALPSFLVFFAIMFRNFSFKFITNSICLILLIISSFHHNYSKILMISNYHYFLIIVLIFLLNIFFILKFEKQNILKN